MKVQRALVAPTARGGRREIETASLKIANILIGSSSSSSSHRLLKQRVCCFLRAASSCGAASARLWPWQPARRTDRLYLGVLCSLATLLSTLSHPTVACRLLVTVTVRKGLLFHSVCPPPVYRCGFCWKEDAEVLNFCIGRGRGGKATVCCGQARDQVV